MFDFVLVRFSKNVISDFEAKNLKTITDKIQGAVEKEKQEENKTTTTFIQNVCVGLSQDFVISIDDLGLKLFLDKADTNKFSEYLHKFVNDMKASLCVEFSEESDLKEKLNSLPFSLQDELFGIMFGCGKQCPFCGVPCEAGLKYHREHHASVHRPLALSGNKMDPDKPTCTSLVCSERTFQNSDTDWKTHPYKDYRRFYPDWNIAPDPSIEPSDYWKYVLVTFNKEFANKYGENPADIPAKWKDVTQDQAMKSLNEVFNSKYIT
ncbi:UNVERIFIED_CONTAM: hypothetical protein FKN15_004117 [Acipenser sinensis]